MKFEQGKDRSTWRTAGKEGGISWQRCYKRNTNRGEQKENKEKSKPNETQAWMGERKRTRKGGRGKGRIDVQ